MGETCFEQVHFFFSFDPDAIADTTSDGPLSELMDDVMSLSTRPPPLPGELRLPRMMQISNGVFPHSD